MLILVSDAEADVLNWMAAKCQSIHLGSDGVYIHPDGRYSMMPPDYSGDWSVAGPLIQDNEISIKTSIGWSSGMKWQAETNRQTDLCYGATPLEAAVRCFITQKLGPEVDVPEAISSKEIGRYRQRG